jgi:hypothetical protein
MTINYTTNLSLAEPVTGSESGTWGDDVNKGLTDYLDIAIAGTLSLTSSSFTANALTLSNTQGNNTSNNIGVTTAQYQILKVGSLTANVTITAPSTSKTYVVLNNDSTYSVTVKASGQTGVTMIPGERAQVIFSGTDYVKGPSTVQVAAAGTLTGTTLASNVVSSSLTSVGTITTGTWNGSLITGTYGGTGVNNGSSTITIGGNVTMSGAYTFTGTLTANTAVTFPTSGTLSTVSLSAANTWTATQTFNGTSSTFATSLLNAAEPATVSATAATGTINFYINSQSVLYYTSNAAANWTLNVAFSSGTSLNAAMSTGQTVTIAFLVTQGSTAYYENVFQIDGTNVTPKWQGGIAPGKGNASGIDVYTYTITKTASATYTVLASQTQFA